MQERTHKDTTDVILFDADASSDVANDWFSFDYWRSRDALRVQSGGRGGVAVISTPAGECVLRHYRRGGMVATLMGDRYLWTGADRTRAFAEFRLLGEIARLGLPGPQVVAARYCRHGVYYTADLNAHNILVTPGQLYVIDFDRCELRQPAEAWRLSNLQRLRRSLVKLGAAAYGDAAFEQAVWQPLLHAYQRTFDA